MTPPFRCGPEDLLRPANYTRPVNGRSAHRLDVRRKNVSCPPFGADQLGTRFLGLDLPAKAADLHIDRAIVDLVVVKARRVDQLLSREHSLRRREKCDP